MQKFQKCTRMRRVWSQTDVRKLVLLVEEGLSWEKIAPYVNKSSKACSSKYQRLSEREKLAIIRETLRDWVTDSAELFLTNPNIAVIEDVEITMAGDNFVLMRVKYRDLDGNTGRLIVKGDVVPWLAKGYIIVKTQVGKSIAICPHSIYGIIGGSVNGEIDE